MTKPSDRFGIKGTGDGQFNEPCSAACNVNGNIFVADWNNHRIQIFDEKGVFKSTFGRYGTGDGEFKYPIGVAIDKEGNYLVADEDNHRIQVFDSTGKFLRKFGSEGTEKGQLKHPNGIGLLSNGNIVVSDYGNHRPQIFTPLGQFLSFVGLGMLKDPCDLYVGSEDHIYVADTQNNRVLVFLQTGQLVKILKTGELNPSGVCVDDEGRIIVWQERSVDLLGGCACAVILGFVLFRFLNARTTILFFIPPRHCAFLYLLLRLCPGCQRESISQKQDNLCERIDNKISLRGKVGVRRVLQQHCDTVRISPAV